MRTIRASEIGNYLYCNRAWWYRLQNVESDNTVELKSGISLHHQHSQQVARVGCTRSLALGLMLVALVITALYFTIQII